MKKNIIGFVLLFNLSICGFAQLANSLLWKISGKDIKESYIYGTIHIQDERVFVFEDIVKQKIDKCEAFSMEILFDNIDFSKMQKLMLMKDKTLEEILKSEELKKLDEYIKEKSGLSIALFRKIKPFFIYAQLLQLQMNSDRKLAMDLEFMYYAKKKNKNLYGLESIEDQIKAIDKISLQEQAKMLLSLVEEKNKMQEELEQLINLYLSQDIDKLFSHTIENEDMPAKFEKYFITNRNKKMTREIIKISRKKSCFHTVGSAHLGGANGILQLLKNKGYKVEAVLLQ